MRHGIEYCFDCMCRLLCPVDELYEEFLDHRCKQSGTGQELNRADISGSMNGISGESAAL